MIMKQKTPVNPEKLQHFSIRKLSIGATSVLIGLSLFGIKNSTVQAATAAPNGLRQNGEATSVDNSTQNTQKGTSQTAQTATDAKQNAQNTDPQYAASQNLVKQHLANNETVAPQQAAQDNHKEQTIEYRDQDTGQKVAEDNQQTADFVGYYKKGQVEVDYRDVTSNKDLQKDTINGYVGAKSSYDPAKSLANYEAKGYQVSQNNFKDIRYSENKQHVEIDLTHKLDNIDSQHPGKYTGDLTKEVSRTINFYNADDQQKKLCDSITQKADFEASGKLDEVTGKLMGNLNWSKGQNLPQMDLPALPHMQLDHVLVNGKEQNLTNIPQLTVNYNDPNTIVDVYYKYNGVKEDEATKKTKNVVETVHFVDTDNKSLLPDQKQTLTFTRSADLVDAKTGELIKSGNWSAEQTFSKIAAPVITHYVANKSDAEKLNDVANKTIDQNASDIDLTIHYQKLGQIVFVDPTGKKADIPAVGYENDPTDATKAGATTLPKMPGYKIVKNPASSGNQQVVMPLEPTKNTTITVDNTQKAVVHFTDLDNNSADLLDPVTITGGSDSAITNDFTPQITRLTNKGYELVNNPLKQTKFDQDFDNDQTLQITFKHVHVKVDHQHPQKPGDPVDPKNPGGTKYPGGVSATDLNKTGTQTIHYVGAGGKTPSDNVQHITLVRDANVDLATGKIDYTSWTLTGSNYTSVKTPDIPHYSADQTSAGGTISSNNFDQPDKNYTVTYTHGPTTYHLGQIEHKVVTREIQPIDAVTKKAIKVTPVVQMVTFTRQQVLNDDNQIAGYGTVSENDNQHFVSRDWATNESFKAIGAPDLSNLGYLPPEKVAIKAETPLSNLPDGHKEVVQIAYQHRIVHVSGNEPEKAGDLVDYDNPKGPKYPAGVDEKDLTKTGTQTVKFVDENGKQIIEPDYEYVHFMRDADVDLVTGAVKYSAWWGNGEYDTVTPNDIGDQEPDQKKVGGDTVKATDKTIDRNYTVTYHLKTIKRALQFIDEDNNDKAITGIKPITITGKINTTISPNELDSITSAINQLKGMHYDLDTDSNPVINKDTKLDDDFPTQLYFKHHLDMVDTPYSYTRKIETTLPGESAEDATNSFKFIKSNQTDTVTGKKLGDIWYIADNNGKKESKFSGAINLSSVIPETVHGYEYHITDANGKDARDIINSSKAREIDPTKIFDDNHKDITAIYYVTYSPLPPQAQNINTELGQVPDPATGIKNLSDLPDHIKIDWQKPDEVKQGCNIQDNTFTTPVTITYPQPGKTATVNVEIHVDPRKTVSLTPDQPSSNTMTTGGGAVSPMTASFMQILTNNKVTTFATPAPSIDPSLMQTRLAKSDAAQANKIVYNTINDDNTDGAKIYYDIVVNGQIVKSGLTPDEAQVEFHNVNSPTLKGYHLVDTKQAQTGQNKVGLTTPNKTVTVYYVGDTQHATVNYLDQDAQNKVVATSGDLTGKTKQDIKYSTKADLQKLIDQGYELVKDNFPNGVKFDDDDTVNQVYTVVVKHGHVVITPDNLPKPGSKINPDDPNSPLYPSLSDMTIKGTQTIHYEAGNLQIPDHVDKTTFKKDVTIDKVTGQVLETQYEPGSYTFKAVNNPVIKGYVTKDKTAGGIVVTPSKPETEITVKYTPVGQIIPVDPTGKEIPDKAKPYDNDPNDPTEILPTAVPNIKDYVPQQKTITPESPTQNTQVGYKPITKPAPKPDQNKDKDNHLIGKKEKPIINNESGANAGGNSGNISTPVATPTVWPTSGQITTLNKLQGGGNITAHQKGQLLFPAKIDNFAHEKRGAESWMQPALQYSSRNYENKTGNANDIANGVSNNVADGVANTVSANGEISGNNTSNNDHNNAVSLPQTGATNDMAIAALGLALISLANVALIEAKHKQN